MSKKQCQFEEQVWREPARGDETLRLNRRDLFKRAMVTTCSLTCLDFFRYFDRFGLPNDSRAFAMAEETGRQTDDPHYLIYWFLEGGWEGYDMFNPVDTPNNVIQRLPNMSDERYRVLKWKQPG